MAVYPNWLTLIFLIIAVAVFLVVAYFDRAEDVRERSVALMLASFGIAVAVISFTFAIRSVENAGEYLGKETEAVGYVTASEDGSADLSLVTMNGKISLKKLRLNTKEALPCGAKLRFVFLSADAIEKDALRDGVFLSGEIVQWEEEGRNYALSAIGSLRNTLLEKLGEEREGRFLKAILLGDRHGLTTEDNAAFQKTAASHLLAISGLHITVLVGMACCMMDSFHMPARWEKAALFPLVIFMYLVTGGAVSVFRASFMALFAASGFLLKRLVDSVTSLIFAACLILLQNPFAVMDLSFLFTFVSTFAILTLASPLCSEVAERIDPYYDETKKWRLYSAASNVLSGALISAGVFLFSLPMNLLIFGEVQLLAPIFSAILIPLFTPCLFVGVAFLLILLLPFSVPFVTEAVHFVIRLFLNLVRLLSAAAPEAVSFGEYNIPVALFLLALFGVFITFRCKLRTFLMLYVSLTAAMLPMVLFA